MKYLGSITEAKDLVTKEYVDSQTTIPEVGDDGVLTFNGSTTVNYDVPLPHVTSEDNGKILMVVEGVWAPQPLTNVSEVGA